jgi:arabinosaccharide transport system substrate-binding protein
VPSLSGKMKVMPLPAWSPGGRRTSVWGGTGLAITKAGRDPELAWQFAKYLYFTRESLGERFLATNIIPPFKDAWSLPEFHKPSAYFGNQPLGALYAALAPETPPVWSNAYSSVADSKLNEAFLRAAAHYDAHGEAGLRPVIESELASAQAYVERVMARNVLARR